MANVYVITNESGTVELSNLSKVKAFLGTKDKITKADIEEGKYPMVTLQEGTESSNEVVATTETTELVEPTIEEPTTEEVVEVEATEEVATDLDPNTKLLLDKIASAINDTPEDNVELFDALCNLEDSVTDGVTLTAKQHDLVNQVLTNTLNTVVEDTDTAVLTDKEDTDTEEDVPTDDTEYPEVGDFSDEKAMKKFVKGLSDSSLEEWCILEGVTWNANDHQSINRMRMAMAIKAKHFPTTAPKAGKKSKSKYASYSTEDLVAMALEHDVEVPDDKGDMRICRMYTIMALKKAGLIE